MPLYEYACDAGHHTEATVKMDGSNAPVKCQHLQVPENVSPEIWVTPWPCGKALTKIMSTNARVFPGANKW